ncbi:two-component sensor histidine kinase [Pseudoroseomonas aestuarii]|uniref:histidine kinase n=2 Tax=Teichococcus aestuarii TaxID=568898 RepID=A0A2U1V7G4_9PROT|nr:two-component sensor histidine kinase [Pseudoroseomonas aestuarii]
MFRWSFAAGVFLVALLARLKIGPALPPGFPYLTFFPAVIVTTFVCGLWPGVAAATASGIAAWYFFIEPFHSFTLDGATAMALGFYALIVTVDVLLIHLMQEALLRLRAESARQSRERELSQQLAESREVMFQELQHRISNNLQVIGALMALQRGAVQDKKARRIIDQAATRLELIGRIHRRLQDPSGQRVELGVFLGRLCDDLLDAAGATGVKVHLQADSVLLPPEQTVPMALILMELVSNALEHGFAHQGQGRIAIELRQLEPATIQLTVLDDGAGLPPDFDLETTQSLGLRIVRALAAQLGASFEMQRAPRGTACGLLLPVR